VRYHTINGWTKERMKAQIREQNDGTRATNANGDCIYATGTGNHCAVGCFLASDIATEEAYESAIVDAGAANIAYQLADIRHPDDRHEAWAEQARIERLMPLREDGLQALQQVHDDPSNDDDIRDALCKWIDKNVIDNKEEIYA